MQRKSKVYVAAGSPQWNEEEVVVMKQEPSISRFLSKDGPQSEIEAKREEGVNQEPPISRKDGPRSETEGKREEMTRPDHESAPKPFLPRLNAPPGPHAPTPALPSLARKK